MNSSTPFKEGSLKEYYPPLLPHHEFFLPVSNLHQIFVHEYGNPQGFPVVFVHGGPGAGTKADHARFFNPKFYRIILFDQRGAGRSKPFASLEQNTTWDLVADMERIRTYLKIEKWAVFGGSWGSTLGLAYALTHPQHVAALFLRGIFLLRKWELQWFYQEGASRLFPEAWEKFLKTIPLNERGDLMSAYHSRLVHPDKKIRLEAARAWSIWEGATCKLLPDQDIIAEHGQDEFAEAFSRIECHYFVNKGFFRHENWWWEEISKIQSIPGVIVHGRYDIVCPVQNAWELHKAWPKAKLVIVPQAGHNAGEEGTRSALIEATDALMEGRL